MVGSWVDEAAQVNPTKTVFHRDHLGSVVAKTDIAASPASLSQELSFDSWGLRRDATDWTGEPSSDPDTTATDRGFTGHEMLDELGLVHMNGRIYDPLLGRMLSADPNIQSPSNFQNYNRYSYVVNNPLSMTDPSGFFFKKLFKSIKKFVKKFAVAIVSAVLAAIVVVATFGVLAPFIGTYYAGIVAAGLGGFTYGFTSTILNGGSLNQALTAGFITGAIAASLAAYGLPTGNLTDINIEEYTEFTQRIGEYTGRASRIYSRFDDDLPQQDGETDNYKWENGAGSSTYSNMNENTSFAEAEEALGREIYTQEYGMSCVCAATRNADFKLSGAAKSEEYVRLYFEEINRARFEKYDVEFTGQDWNVQGTAVSDAASVLGEFGWDAASFGLNQGASIDHFIRTFKSYDGALISILAEHEGRRIGHALMIDHIKVVDGQREFFVIDSARVC